MPLQAITSREPIPGYQIRERIGAGGYGEVWRADAPGGLSKAIKFVYGYLDEDRATRELKALSRIKSVRHPFLLSLERIEVVDGQLLIVTELAECSLKDRFDECRREGLPGIPRDELLQYLQDAADVLDYMSKNHSLQHLDVKPENLLVLAGRIKVADFGLVKDLHDITASMMGGLTPLYAPPEVFDGRPTKWSDQYSLAIVYQEMLTGELPFPGTTAMQLAQQHMNARPRLACLPERDQEVLRRALAKSPHDRFSDCRTLIGSLLGIAPAEATTEPSAPGEASSAGPSSPSHTAAMTNTASQARWASRVSAVHVPRIDPEARCESLPPLEAAAPRAALRPTVFLGVGGTAGRILVGLRKRMEDQLGSPDAIPAVQTLLVDTDGKDLLRLSRQQTDGGLLPEQMVSIPLRRPQDYRKCSAQLLGWLSRRWLYNIPRSLKTEGLRPLGRLALIDRLPEVKERLSLALQTISCEEAHNQSREASGLDFSTTRPQIIVVGSLSGGTGSGIAVDLGYLVQHLLDALELPEGDVRAVLTHSTGRSARWKELAAVNTYSALCELNYFAHIGGVYPGGKQEVVPKAIESAPPFQQTYLVHLGNDLSEYQYHQAAEQVAGYLFLDLATPAGSFFQACRESEAEPPNTSDMLLRTFGLRQFSCLKNDVVSIAIEHLSRHVLERRLLGDQCPEKVSLGDSNRLTVSVSSVRTQSPDYANMAPDVEELIAGNNFEVQKLVDETMKGIQDELGEPISAFVIRQVEQVLGEIPQDASAVARIAQVWYETWDRLVGSEDSLGCNTAERGILEMALAPHRKNGAVRIADAIRELVYAKVDDYQIGARGAIWLAQRFLEYCKSLSAQTTERLQKTQQQLAPAKSSIATLANPASRKDRRSSAQLADVLVEYGHLRLDTFVLHTVGSVLHMVEAHITSIEEELTDLSRQLRQLVDQFDVQTVPKTASEDATRDIDYQLQESANQFIIKNFDLMAERINTQLEQDLMAGSNGWSRFLRHAGDQLNRLPEQLRTTARTTLLTKMKEFNIAGSLFDDDQHPDYQIKTLKECLDTARPRLLDCGGAQRLLVMLPQSTTHARPVEIIQTELNETPTVITAEQTDFIFCYEVERMSLTQVAVTLIDERPDYVDFAGRVHTRRDIKWPPLPDLV